MNSAPPFTPVRRKVLLVGWDSADWEVIRPLLAEGQMPHLARLIDEGCHGNLATISPAFSPMLWTSISTGKRPTRHGIHGFTEPTPDGTGIRPITLLGRRCKAVWNIFNQSGLRPAVVGWWPSHPAEPLNGVMVSNFFHQAGQEATPRPLPHGCIHPPEWSDRLAELRTTPLDLPGELLRLFVPEYPKVDQARDKRLHSLAKILSETLNLHAAATEVLEHAVWDFAGIYYDSLDHFSHAFMNYHPPRLPWVNEADFEIYQGVVANAYRYHDAMLGRLLQLAGPETTVIVMSDHGFQSGVRRPGRIPAAPAGPAIEHRHFGIFCARGPDIRPGTVLYGASILDITPTLLHLYGLPVGADMDGKVLHNLFNEVRPAETIPSWESLPGESGEHPPETRSDPVESAEALRQLVALGYVAPPAANAAAAVADTVAELRFNLANAHSDAGEIGPAAALLTELVAQKPAEIRFLGASVEAEIRLGNLTRATTLLDDFDRHIERSAPEAAAELERRRKERPEAELGHDDQEAYERRALAERATGYPLHRGLLRLKLDLLAQRSEAVTQGLAELMKTFARFGLPQPRRLLAETLAWGGYHREALEHAEAAVERDPDDWQMWALTARMRWVRRQPRAALAAAAESLGRVRFQPELHTLVGRVWQRLGDPPAAEAAYREALAQSPGLPEPRQRLAALLARRGRTDEAAEHRRRLLAPSQKSTPAKPIVKSAPAASLVESHPAWVERVTGPATADEIIVVAGLPRSGTSMLMQLLAAGGVPVLTDGKRAADSDNPRGYLEFEPATTLRQDPSWIPSARGHAVKLVLPLVPFLPLTERYRLLVIERDLAEVLASQAVMLDRLERRDQGARLGSEALARQFASQRIRVASWLHERPEFSVLALRYTEVVAAPLATAQRVAEFLGRPFDCAAAARAIDPALRRQSLSK